MKAFWIIFYNFLLYPIFLLGVIFTSIFNKKVREGFLGRFNSKARLLNFIKNVDTNLDVYWFHAASHGEFEQIKPVIDGLKEVEPDLLFIVSFFSPSGFNNVIDKHIDCKIYLPFDLPWSISKTLTIVKPKKIIFAEYDVWPNLVWFARKKDISTTIFSVHFSNKTPKLFPLIRSFYKSIYDSFTHIYSETKDDYKKVSSLIGKYSQTKVKVLGNPRYDQVKKKTDHFTKKRTLSVLSRDKRIIAGSVWKEDEETILDPLIQFLQQDNSVSLLWVPHEPTEIHIKRVFVAFEEAGFDPVIYRGSKINNLKNNKITIVGTVGILSSLYWEGQLAYIGGGFSTGVHNVMEPAIARLPVLFGPNYGNSHAAKELLESYGGFCISNDKEFMSKLNDIFSDKNLLLRSSSSATNVIHKNLGSSTRIVREILRD